MEDADQPECWALCETDGSEPLAGAERNSVVSCEEIAQGQYELMLDHGARAGYVTTIQYLGDLTGASYVEYTHHPANMDGSLKADANDIIEIVLCVSNPGTCENYRADVDASGIADATDITVVVDLLNGADEFEPWFGTELPENQGDCPALCDRGGALEGGGREGGGGRALEAAPEVEQEAEPFGRWFAGFIRTADPTGESEMAEFSLTVESLTGWCAEHLSVTEKRELIALLTDPEAEFANAAVEAMVRRIVAGLEQ